MINLKQDKLNSEVYPILDNLIKTDLSSAYNSCTKALNSLPNDFSGRTSLVNCKTNISEIKNLVKEVKNKLEDLTVQIAGVDKTASKQVRNTNSNLSSLNTTFNPLYSIVNKNTSNTNNQNSSQQNTKDAYWYQKKIEELTNELDNTYSDDGRKRIEEEIKKYQSELSLLFVKQKEEFSTEYDSINKLITNLQEQSETINKLESEFNEEFTQFKAYENEILIKIENQTVTPEEIALYESMYQSLLEKENTLISLKETYNNDFKDYEKLSTEFSVKISDNYTNWQDDFYDMITTETSEVILSENEINEYINISSSDSYKLKNSESQLQSLYNETYQKYVLGTITEEDIKSLAKATRMHEALITFYNINQISDYEEKQTLKEGKKITLDKFLEICKEDGIQIETFAKAVELKGQTFDEWYKEYRQVLLSQVENRIALGEETEGDLTFNERWPDPNSDDWQEKQKFSWLKNAYRSRLNMYLEYNTDVYGNIESEKRELAYGEKYNIIEQNYKTYQMDIFTGKYYAPENLKSLILSEDSDIKYVYDYGTESQKELINYIIKQQGIDKGIDFAKDIKPLVDQNKAEQIGQDFKNAGFLGQIGLGAYYTVGAGVEDIGRSFVGVGKFLVGDTSYTFDGIHQLGYGEIQENTDNVVGKFLMDSGRAVVVMAPSLAAYSVNPVLGRTMLGTVSFGGSYVQSINAGKSYFDAVGIAAVSTATELTLESFVGGIFNEKSGLARLTANQKGNILNKFNSVISNGNYKMNTFLKVTGSYLKDNSSEFIEEGLSTFLEPIIEYIVSGDNNIMMNDETLENILYSGMVGMFSAGIVNLPKSIKSNSSLNNIFEGKATTKDFNLIMGEDTTKKIFEDVTGLELNSDARIAQLQLEVFNKASKNGTQTKLEFNNTIADTMQKYAQQLPEMDEITAKAIVDSYTAKKNLNSVKILEDIEILDVPNNVDNKTNTNNEAKTTDATNVENANNVQSDSSVDVQTNIEDGTNITNNVNKNNSLKSLAELNLQHASSTLGSLLFIVPFIKNRYIYKNTNTVSGLNQQIKDNGLYHFTSETAADLIMESQYVKVSKKMTYGEQKAFFFNGIPSIGAYTLNVTGVPLKTTAIKVVPSDSALESDNMRVRIGDDGAITWNGDFKFDGNTESVEKVYLCLFKENGQYVYKEVSQDVYNNYETTHAEDVDLFARGENALTSYNLGLSYIWDVYSNKVLDKTLATVSKVEDVASKISSLINSKQAIKDTGAVLAIDSIEQKIYTEYDSYIEDIDYDVFNKLKDTLAKKIEINQNNKQLSYEQIINNIKSKLQIPIVELYNLAKETGKKFAAFLGYEEHNFLHVTRVADTSVKVLEELEKMIDSGSIDGLAKIDKDIVHFAGICHDLGMKDGGYVLFKDGTFAKISDVMSNLEQYDTQVRELVGKLKSSDSLSDVFDLEGLIIRKQHPLNSAIEVLKNRENLTEYADNIDLIACLTLIHSKSTSGVKDVTSATAISQMIKKLYDNQSAGNYIFDISKLVEIDENGQPLMNDGVYVFKSDMLEKLTTGAIALRIGDAHAEKTGYNHGDYKINIVNRAGHKYTLDKYKEIDLAVSDLCVFEAENSDIIIGDKENGTNLSGGSYDYSKQIVLGESNVINKEPIFVPEKGLVHTFSVKSIDTPACTWIHGIVEKFGEYATFQNVKQHVVIELPSNAVGMVELLYNKFVDAYKKEMYLKYNSKDYLTFEIKIMDAPNVKLDNDSLLADAQNYENNEKTGIGVLERGIDASKYNLSEKESSMLQSNPNSAFGFNWWDGKDWNIFENIEKSLSFRKERLMYLELDRQLFINLLIMKKNGASLREMAEYGVYFRNLAKLKVRDTGKLSVKCKLALRNIATYGYLKTTLNAEIFGKYFYEEINEKRKRLDIKFTSEFKNLINQFYTELGIDDNTPSSDERYYKFLKKISDSLGIEEEYIIQHALGPTFEEVYSKTEKDLKEDGIVPTEEQIYNKMIPSSLSPNKALNVALGISPEIGYSWNETDINKYLPQLD